MARSKKKKDEEGEIPIMHGWQMLPIRELVQDDELMTLAARRVNLKKNLYGDDLPEPKGIYFDEETNTLFIYYQTEPRGMVRPTDNTLRVYTIESKDNRGVLYHSNAAIEIKNFKQPPIVYDYDDAAEFISRRAGESKDNVIEFLEAKRDYLTPRSRSRTEEGCFVETHYENPNDTLQFIQSVTTLSIRSVVKMMVEEVAYMEQLGGTELGAYQDALAWQREQLGNDDIDDAPLVG